MELPKEVETVVLRPSDMKLMGAAAIFLVLFVIGFALEVGRDIGIALMLASIFFCIVMQGMRGRKE